VASEKRPKYPSGKEQWSEIKKRDSNASFLTKSYVNTIIKY
jgi:hypothetical protein